MPLITPEKPTVNADVAARQEKDNFAGELADCLAKSEEMEQDIYRWMVTSFENN